MTYSKRIVVSFDGSGVAAQYAATLGLPLVPIDFYDSNIEFLLRVHNNRLELVPNWPGAPGPICCDFRYGAMGYRVRNLSLRRELLLRAVRSAGGIRSWPRVFDATAGLGRDAFLLAAAGCTVFLIERDPIVYALLADGLKRVRAEPQLADIAARIAEPQQGEATAFLAEAIEAARIDIVYLDPMFEPDTLGGKSKKEMQVLQRLIHSRDDGQALFAAASASKRVRIVVKRGRHAPPLTAVEPNRVFIGRRVRYDVYEPVS